MSRLSELESKISIAKHFLESDESNSLSKENRTKMNNLLNSLYVERDACEITDHIRKCEEFLSSDKAKKRSKEDIKKMCDIVLQLYEKLDDLKPEIILIPLSAPAEKNARAKPYQGTWKTARRVCTAENECKNAEPTEIYVLKPDGCSTVPKLVCSCCQGHLPWDDKRIKYSKGSRKTERVKWNETVSIKKF